MTGVCAVCGASFEIPKNNPRKRFCSLKCRNFENNHRRSSAAMCRDKAKAAAEMRERLAARDAEYAAAGFPVAVELRGGRRVETRGQRCIGARAAGFVKHS